MSLSGSRSPFAQRTDVGKILEKVLSPEARDGWADVFAAVQKAAARA